MKEVIGECVLVVNDNKLLCCKNLLQDCWGLPRVFFDAKDSFLWETIRDKFYDEFKLVFNSEISINSIEIVEQGVKYRISASICSLVSFGLGSDDNIEFKWISLDEINDIQWNEYHKNFIKSFEQYLEVQDYTLTMDKEARLFVKLEKNFENLKRFVDVIWQGTTTKLEAIMRFNSLIRQENKKHRANNTSHEWKAIRLFDSNGNIIKQES